MKRGRRALDTLDDDIRDHIERETRENLDRGMTPEEARRQALLKFGNAILVREDTRAIWLWQRMEQLAQDSWYASPYPPEPSCVCPAFGAHACSRYRRCICGIRCGARRAPEPDALRA